jgi:2-polyprenyl-3-methyl-5-hydroxy-6-metoxy-1,4-benzoquinol methylase
MSRPERAALVTSAPHCRLCGAELTITFADLGMSPLANAFLPADALGQMEPFYPLHARVCGDCWLVQVDAFETPERIFSDYAYFSSYSSSWLQHARQFTADAVRRFDLRPDSLVVEVASNDGYLLQYFRGAGIPVLGIEPAENVAEAARSNGIETISRFMGMRLAKELVAQRKAADLLVGINVFAHVPDLHDFVAGLEHMLKPKGTLCLEFPHLLRLIDGCQFDTIYHEHFSYFSLITAIAILAWHGLAVYDVEELPTHGGSLRIYARREAARASAAVTRILEEERRRGLDRSDTYRMFADAVQRTKRNLLRFLIDAREHGRQVVGYGAPAKANTLLNYCGIRSDLLSYTVDISPHKQGRFLPGTHIPIYSPAHIDETRPEFVLILPWNLSDEIMGEMAHIRGWGGRFVIPLPQVKVVG